MAFEKSFASPPNDFFKDKIMDTTIIEYLLKCKRQGLDVQGLMDDSLSKIKVIKEDWKEFDYGKNILPDGKKLIGEGYHI